MKTGIFEVNTKDEKILDIGRRVLGGGEPFSAARICERYGDEDEDVREYDVYRLKTSEGYRILKKASEREVANYEKYLNGGQLNVPDYYGKYQDGEALWIMLENVEGDDLRNMTDALAVAAAESIAAIHNRYWNNSDMERFDAYMERIGRRYSFAKNEPIVGEAYKLFLDRQKTCPRTLTNGDFLQFNAIENGGKVYVIDWGFGGVMPYSLDIARFISHATEERATFPFYMTDTQKKLFVRTVYDSYAQKPDYAQYLYDIKLAMLNEYVEFVEADEDESGWYLEHARALAKEIMQE